MNPEDLPWRLMRTLADQKTKGLFKTLDILGVMDKIARTYQSLEDRADAFDGAFLGARIAESLSAGRTKEEVIPEVFDVHYDWEEERSLNSSYFNGLKQALEASERSDFYDLFIGCIEEHL